MDKERYHTAKARRDAAQASLFFKDSDGFIKRKPLSPYIAEQEAIMDDCAKIMGECIEEAASTARKTLTREGVASAICAMAANGGYDFVVITAPDKDQNIPVCDIVPLPDGRVAWQRDGEVAIFSSKEDEAVARKWFEDSRSFKP